MPYSALDARIIESIKAGNKSFTRIVASINAGLSSRSPDFTPGQLIDRRLRMLKQKKKVIFTGSSTRSVWGLPGDNA